jgi:myo-inositol-1(or 4)-monophosphatase
MLNGGISALVNQALVDSGRRMERVVAEAIEVKHRYGNDHYTLLTTPLNHQILLVHLDGGEGYVFGHPNYAMGVSCSIDDEVLFSGVFNPYYGALFFAEQAKSVKRNNVSVAVNKVSSLRDSYLGLSYRGDYGADGQQLLKRFFGVMGTPARTMIPGSDLYGLTLVANGNLSAMVIGHSSRERLQPGLWLVEQAGGKVSFISSSENLPEPDLVVASNGLIHDELMQQLLLMEAQ